ncbi:MAG: hypothetical protein MI919_43485, partial [Holophagales bacterium]|nr:hypothetical protein [Holophagales bacterium]
MAIVEARIKRRLFPRAAPAGCPSTAEEAHPREGVRRAPGPLALALWLGASVPAAVPGFAQPFEASGGGTAESRGADDIGIRDPSTLPGRDRRPFRFHRITAEDGLAQGSVFSLLQDRHGFVWIGTQDGLHRYDGHRFEIHKPDPFDPESLSHGMVHSLLEDASGRLWAGTFRGLDRLHATGTGFERTFAAVL